MFFLQVSHHLARRMTYDKGERDMILLRHEVTVRWPDNRRELKGINMVSRRTITKLANKFSRVDSFNPVVPLQIEGV